MPASIPASVIRDRRLLRSSRSVLGLLALLGPDSALVAQTSSVALPPPVTVSTLDRLLDAPPFDRHLWGIALTGDRGTLEYARNADRLFILASNTKLVVAGAASTLLDPALRVATSVYASGPVRNGVVQGDLILYGRGDPTLSRRCYDTDTTRTGACDRDPLDRLRDLADRLAERGITAVEGDLVGDGSWFQGPRVHPTWETADLTWWYAAPVTGLGFNDNSVDVTATPTSPGAPAAITLYPALPEIVLDNQTRTGAPGESLTFDLHWAPTGEHPWRLVATGVLPPGRTRRVYAAIADPDRFTALAFRTALAERGIVVRGSTTATGDSLATRTARSHPPLAETWSRPLSDWIFPVLNTSQNWFAEMLLRQLDRQTGGAGTWTGGLALERRWLIDSVGLDSTSFALRDASGLSATNFMTPAAMTRLLSWIRDHPRWPVFSAGLPRSGRPGSLRTRFVGTPLEGRVVAKTGSISTVNTLSGYIEREDGRPLVISILANHHLQGGSAMIARIDSVVAAIVGDRR